MLYKIGDVCYDAATNRPIDSAYTIVFTPEEVAAVEILGGSNLSKIRQVQIVKRLTSRLLLECKVLVEHGMNNQPIF